MADNNIIRIGVGAVIFRGDQVLLIRRGKNPFKGAWSIPGGKLDYGETLEGAVRREILEETGVEVGALSLIDVFEAPPGADGRTDGGHYVMIDYVAEWSAGEPVADDDAEEASFVDIKEALARLSWDETRRALERALEIRQERRKSS